jgi:hypothetical protein
MAQRNRESKLDTRCSRDKLAPSGKPYYRMLRPGLHLGYRKGRIGSRWVARVYLGSGRYVVETVASADDQTVANGTDILNYADAQRAVELIFCRITGHRTQHGRLTVATVLEEYLLHLETEGRPTGDARNRASLHILPRIGHYAVSALTSQTIRSWMKEVAETPARVRTRANARGPAFRARQSAD